MSHYFCNIWLQFLTCFWVGNRLDQSDVTTNISSSNIITLYDFIQNLEPVKITPATTTTLYTDSDSYSDSYSDSDLNTPRYIQVKKKNRKKSWCSCRKSSTICAIV